MKLSEHDEYRRAEFAFAKGDFESAKLDFSTVIARAEVDGDFLTLAYLLQRLGNAEAETGNIECGHGLHRRAIEINSDSPLFVLFYAQALVSSFGDIALAEIQIALVEERVNAPGWDPGPNSPSVGYYHRECDKLRACIRDVPPEID